jgi:N-acetylglucosamine kinase-like BadF-type ATPase
MLEITVPYYLGIDGGGTKTTCALGDDSQLIATATAGPSNIIRVGETQARESLQQSVRQACAAAGITPAQVAHSCVGGSGAARPELAAIVRRILTEILPTPIDVVGDIQTSLEAAFHTGPGVIVIAGTGSIAFGRDRAGNTLRAGGWGFAIGDEGSAHWIGRAAVSAVLRAADPRDGTPASTTSSSRAPQSRMPRVSPPLRDLGGLPEQGRPQDSPQVSSLAQALCKAWGVNTLDDLARAANSTPPPDFATLCPAVVASEGAIALQVLSRAGRELAQVVAVVSQRLFAQEDAALVPVAMIGGVFRHSPIVRTDFYNELRQLDPRAEINPQVVDPVEGALRMARRAGTKVD